jgi:hypothetical protein
MGDTAETSAPHVIRHHQSVAAAPVDVLNGAAQGRPGESSHYEMRRTNKATRVQTYRTRLSGSRLSYITSPLY